MVEKQKVAYPNLQESIKKLGEAHQAIHDAIKTHAAAHAAALEAKRRDVSVKQDAKKLMEG